MPLIARMIAAIDGPDMLNDPAIAAYARGLTRLWSLYQFALALIGVLLAVAAWSGARAPLLPGPRLFGLLLPLLVAALLLAEFALRPRLLPQAPRHSLPAFVRGIARAWPLVLAD
jgi:uncharacterized membrane protein